MERNLENGRRRRMLGYRFWVFWLVGSEMAILLIPTWLVYGDPAWSAERTQLILGFGLAQFVSLLAVALFAVLKGRILAADAFKVSGAVLGILYLTLLVLRPSAYSRAVLLLASAFVVTSGLLPALWVRSRRVGVVLAVSLILSGPAIQLARGAELEDALGRGADDGQASSVSRTILPASYYTLRITQYDGFVPSTDVIGGAIDHLGADLLLLRGDGELYHVANPVDGDSLDVTRLGIMAPMNRDAFVLGASSKTNTNRFRAADLLVEDRGASVRLLASHHYWRADRDCFVLRVSTVDVARSRLLRQGAPVDWKTLYETEPCLPLREEGRASPFAGHMAGGRLSRLGPDRYLLTVGDHGFNGWDSNPVLSQDDRADYGKILLLEEDGGARAFTTGHRNPQGLHVSPEGSVWSTEHGPQGGDELNLLTEGKNFGWPYTTMGTAYGMDHWPVTAEDSTDYADPVYAWIPSVGVSNVISVQGPLFEEWRGDLLIGSMQARTLFRVRVRGGRVRSVEPFEIGGRIRDLVEHPSGRIAMFLDTEGLVILGPADPAADGEAIFASRCAGCHEIDGGGSSSIGPDLLNVYERTIGWEDGYAYSAALDSLVANWSEPALDDFLTDPQEFAPGTLMEWEGMEDPDRRRALLAYLKQLQG